MDPIFGLIQESPVSFTILAITLITSIKAFREPELNEKMLFIPYRVIHYHEPYRLLSSGLIHAHVPHLAFNMLSFYFFAPYFERVIGHWQFTVFYVLALILSEITTLFKHKDSPHYRALGASGAVSAVVIGMILCFPTLPIYLLFIPIGIPGWIFALLYIGYSHYASRNANDNIGHEAHLWGALSGIGLTLLLYPEVIGQLRNWLAI